jgi:hypothetical protein
MEEIFSREVNVKVGEIKTVKLGKCGYCNKLIVRIDCDGTEQVKTLEYGHTLRCQRYFT